MKFATEEQAHKALINLRGRYYCGRIVQAEYSPVTDFREGRCRQFDEHNCLRGGYCNFLHLKTVPRFARRYLRRTRLRNRYRHPYGIHYQKKLRDDDWPRFPVRGTSEERRRCIAKWNKLLKEQLERKQRKQKKKELKRLKREKREREKNKKKNKDKDVKEENGEDKDEKKKDLENGNDGDVKMKEEKKEDEQAAPYMNPERLAMLSGQ